VRPSSGAHYSIGGESQSLYENLPGQGKADKARELVAYVRRHQQEAGLLAACRQLRPAVAWPGATPPATPVPATPVTPIPAHPAPPQPAPPLEPPEGTMRPDSPFYIPRQPAERVAQATAQAREGGTLTIKGPRQVGKSSLLIRVMAAVGEAGKQVAYLDFQEFDEGTRIDADTFFLKFARLLGYELGLAEPRDADWPLALGTVHRCTRYIERVLLPALGAPLLLAMDEVDSILDCPFRTDFFAMLRVWHNNRAMPNRPIWRKLDLALVTSTEPYELVQNLHQSPFNVGEVIELSDFDAAQVAQLNALHGGPLSQGDEARLLDLLGGHPYLTRRALYLVADGRLAWPSCSPRPAARAARLASTCAATSSG
jgi:hypothetical protein